MKRLYTYLSISCAALLAFMLVSCGGGNDYRHVIPADSFAVISVNPKSMAHKAQVGDFTQSIYYKMIDRELGDSDMDADKRAYILSLISHPANTGLDMDNDAFMFIRGSDFDRGDFELGMLFKVKNRKDLDKFMDWVEDESELENVSEGGLTIFTDPDKWNTVAIAYNDDACLMYITDDEYSSSKQELRKLFTQKKSDSMMDIPHMESAFNGSNDMLITMNYGPVMAAIEGEMSMMGGMGMAGFEWMSDMSIVMPVNFEKGKIVSDTRIFFASKDSEKEFKKMSEITGKMGSDFLKMLPDQNIAIIAAKMKGSKMTEFFKSIPMYSMVFAMVPQAQQIMEALDGDFALSFHGMSADCEVPLLTVIAELGDTAIVETIKGLIPVPVEENTPGHYSVNLGAGEQGFFGLNGKTFYITTSQGALPFLMGNETSSFNKNMSSLVRDSYGVMYIDMTMLRSMLEMLIAERVISRDIAAALPVIGLFESVEMTSPTVDAANTVIHMTDKSKNSLEIICKTIEGFAQMFMGLAF